MPSPKQDREGHFCAVYSIAFTAFPQADRGLLLSIRSYP